MTTDPSGARFPERTARPPVLLYALSTVLMTSGLRLYAVAMHSPIVFPETVMQSVLRSPISASSFITAYTPPASLRSSMYVGPAGARWQRLGVFSLIGLANLISKSNPISCAIAGR